MGSTTGRRHALFVAELVAITMCNLCLIAVNANLSNATNFYWAPERGKMLGDDSVQLSMDTFGGSGITSKESLLYGRVQMQIKLIAGNSAGSVTAFYLSSLEDEHDEIDFEFLGNVEGKYYTIHTNIFTKGVGGRERQFRVWFDPTTDYHTYTIFWNPYEVVWLVDEIPIRVFRKYRDTSINFPDSQAMKMFASVWNAEEWATNGGAVKTDWTLVPFTAYFRGYETDACLWESSESISKCADWNNKDNRWASPAFFKLSPAQLGQMNWVMNNSMIYDYCTDTDKYKENMPKECSLPQF